MKIRIIALWVFVGLGFFACQKPAELTDTRPAIKSVSFTGVPAENVRFDAANATITVQLPAVLSGGLRPVFTLSEGTSVIDGVQTDNTIDLTPFCYCNRSSQSREVVIRVGNNTGTSVYRLNVITSGQLKAQNSNTSITFSRQTKLLEMSLPVENLYSNPHINTIDFTNVETGALTRINADAACLNTCQSNAPNQLIFRLSSPIERELLLGTYAISLAGIVFPQQLVVTE
ncbi:hypothetical protein [Spirosoma harenae]